MIVELKPERAILLKTGGSGFNTISRARSKLFLSSSGRQCLPGGPRVVTFLNLSLSLLEGHPCVSAGEPQVLPCPCPCPCHSSHPFDEELEFQPLFQTIKYFDWKAPWLPRTVSKVWCQLLGAKSCEPMAAKRMRVGAHGWPDFPMPRPR